MFKSVVKINSLIRSKPRLLNPNMFHKRTLQLAGDVNVITLFATSMLF